MTVHVRVRVAGESYAVPVENVLEVTELAHVVPVPGAQQSVLGVLNLRGRVLPVLDLAHIFGIAREGVPRHMVVAEDGTRQAGFAIDEVLDVEALPPPGEKSDSPFLLGATLTDDALVGIIDVPRVLDAVADGAS